MLLLKYSYKQEFLSTTSLIYFIRLSALLHANRIKFLIGLYISANLERQAYESHADKEYQNKKN